MTELEKAKLRSQNRHAEVRKRKAKKAVTVRWNREKLKKLNGLLLERWLT